MLNAGEETKMRDISLKRIKDSNIYTLAVYTDNEKPLSSKANVRSHTSISLFKEDIIKLKKLLEGI